MFYKPKFCCDCGAEIERIEWKLFSSRRFCEVCETDFKPQEWLPRIITAAGLLLGLLGLGSYLQTPDRPLQIASRQTGENSAAGSGKRSDTKEQIIADSNSRNLSLVRKVQTDKSSPSLNEPPQNDAAAKIENKTADSAPTYFCGAATKKGTPCSRRIKGGGRCWQHAGQAAILPPEKLIASR